jgi:hypothetical protein
VRSVLKPRLTAAPRESERLDGSAAGGRLGRPAGVSIGARDATALVESDHAGADGPRHRLGHEAVVPSPRCAPLAWVDERSAGRDCSFSTRPGFFAGRSDPERVVIGTGDRAGVNRRWETDVARAGAQPAGPRSSARAIADVEIDRYPAGFVSADAAPGSGRPASCATAPRQVGINSLAKPSVWHVCTCSAAPTGASTADGRPTFRGAWLHTDPAPPAATRVAAARLSSRSSSGSPTGRLRCERRPASSGSPAPPSCS